MKSDAEQMEQLLNCIRATTEIVVLSVPWKPLAMLIELDDEKGSFPFITFVFYSDAPEWTKNNERTEFRWRASVEDLKGMRSSEVALKMIRECRERLDAGQVIRKPNPEMN